jgi:aspartyl protease family protein
MRAGAITGLFGVALLLGWFWPDAASDPLVATDGSAIANRDMPESDTGMEADSESGPGEETELVQQGDGHYYANVAVNDTDIRFLVDTGASSIALTADDAEEIGLSWSEDELRKVGRGVGGEVYGKPVVLSSVQLGELSARNVSAVIIPEGLHVSLLGQSFLSKATTVKIENGKMIIS